jgi:hypothetical protein
LTVPHAAIYTVKAWSLGGQSFWYSSKPEIYFLFPQMPPMKLLTPPTLLDRLLCASLTLDKSLLCSSHSSSFLEANVAPTLVDGL